MRTEREEGSWSDMTRRSLLTNIGVGGLGISILAACGTAEMAPATEPEAKEEMKEEKQAEAAPVTEEVTLRYFSWFSDRDRDNVQSVMFDPFAEANPGTTVELIVAPGELGWAKPRAYNHAGWRCAG